MNERLTAQSLKGIWAGPPVFWDERYRLDEDTQVENWKRTCYAQAARVRPPYIGWTPEEVEKVREWLRKRDDLFDLS
ncbi:MAG: hypothetical protein QGH74_00565 [Candidatus Brocadiia bacterium]|nr:hypothetical protein [Candidatus Brocadiia bacterium]